MTDKNAQKLLPCPFCGSDNVKIKLETRTIDYVTDDISFVSCDQCFARGARAMNGKKESRVEMAIAAWNRRAENSALVQEIERLKLALDGARGEAKDLRHIIRQIVISLPARLDWLDPDVEKMARKATKERPR